MGSDSLGRYREKSFLALVSFVFRGWVKYAVVALLLAAASLPLVITGSTFRGFLELPPVAAALRLIGAGGVEDGLGGKDSGELVKAAIKKQAGSPASAAESGQPCGDDCRRSSSLDMVKGNVYRKSGRVPPGRIAGALYAADADGVTDVVNFGKITPGKAGPEKGRGTPYIGSLINSGVIGREDNLYASALRSGSNMFPLPGKPRRAGSGYAGRSSRVSRRYLRYTSASSAYKRFGSKRPVSQLAQAVSVADSASRFSDAKFESQAAYAGAVYDGDDIDLDVLVTREAQPLSGDGFVDDLNAAQSMRDLAERCSKAQDSNGTRLYGIGREMDGIQAGMTSPPSCGGNVDPWNRKVAKLYQLCLEFNSNQMELAKSCQASGGGRMDCAIYASDSGNGNGLIVRKCSKSISGVAAVFSVPAAMISAALDRFRSD